MLAEIADHLRAVGPFFAGIWAVTILSVLLRPQRYFNSFLLMLALMVTMIFLSGFFGEAGPVFLLVCFLLVMLALFLVPVLLIVNGVRLIRRESLSPSHLLSLGLGVVVGIGEIATVVYVLDLYGSPVEGHADLWVLMLAVTVFYFSFLVLSFVVYTVFIQIMPHRMNFNYVIIHGCGLLGGDRVSKLLRDRLDKAIEVYRQDPTPPKLIPSGGQGADEVMSEAEAMRLDVDTGNPLHLVRDGKEKPVLVVRNPAERAVKFIIDPEGWQEQF